MKDVNIEKVRERQKIQNKRLELLDTEHELWMKNCHVCKLIPEAIKRGELSKSTCRDRANHICDACDVHHKIRDIGDSLDSLMKRDKQLREPKPFFKFEEED